LLPDRRDFLLADGERIACACSCCWYGKSKVYFEEDRAAEERAACPHYQEESSQRFSTHRDGFKLVFESNKCILSKFGTSVGKSYESGGLFRLSLSDVCNKVAYNVINVDETNVWHSRLCHVNFGRMMRLSNLSLIPKFTFIKNSKCHVCVESRQTRKPHKTVEARSLASLELIHSDLCEMNGVLTKGEKKYFMTLIDDSTRFCYIYLLKSKDEALHYFKIYKDEIENQL
jgi:hypothetical protein